MREEGGGGCQDNRVVREKEVKQDIWFNFLGVTMGQAEGLR